MEGSCRFGLWYVFVEWEKDIVHRVRFTRSAPEGPVPESITRYLAGKTRSLSPLKSSHITQEGTYGDIYREVSSIPYGSVSTYGEIADRVGTGPRVVGMAMMRNQTPLIIPCHRVVSKDGIGGFTPSPDIKRMLLDLETNTMKKKSKSPGS